MMITWLNIPAIVVTLATFIGLQGMSLVLRPQAGGTITLQLEESVRSRLEEMCGEYRTEVGG